MNFAILNKTMHLSTRWRAVGQTDRILRASCSPVRRHAGSVRYFSLRSICQSFPAELSDTSLLRQQNYVGGEWIDSNTQRSIAVTNPATGEEIATVPNLSADEVYASIDAANTAFPEWSQRTAKERSKIIRKWYDLMMQHKTDLATIMVAEQGKPMAEALGEINYGADFLDWFSEEAKRIYGDIIPGNAPNTRLLVMKQPVGVCAAITPWNFPTAMITRKAGAAIAAGCTVVVKPSELTPLSALAVAELAERAGVPPGVLNVVTGDAEAVGGALTGSKAVRKISFTGSTRVGKLLMGQSADTVKRTSMELGGSAPFIVFDDADLDKALAGLLASKYRNSGQTCVCADRVLVQAKVYDRFMAMLVKASEALVMGPGLEGPTDQGPLINEAAVQKCESHIADAVAKGAAIATGGSRASNIGPTFFQPTVLDGCTTDMKIFREETFGPVVPLIKFETEQEAIALANDTDMGLASYVYSNDLGTIFRVSEAMEYGIVGANVGIISAENAPFGGVKESGVGREGSKYGCDEYVNIKYVCLGI